MVESSLVKLYLGIKYLRVATLPGSQGKILVSEVRQKSGKLNVGQGK